MSFTKRRGIDLSIDQKTLEAQEKEMALDLATEQQRGGRTWSPIKSMRKKFVERSNSFQLEIKVPGSPRFRSKSATKVKGAAEQVAPWERVCKDCKDELRQSKAEMNQTIHELSNEVKLLSSKLHRMQLVQSKLTTILCLLFTFGCTLYAVSQFTEKSHLRIGATVLSIVLTISFTTFAFELPFIKVVPFSKQMTTKEKDLTVMTESKGDQLDTMGNSIETKEFDFAAVERPLKVIDGKAGMRFNFMHGSGVPFKPLYDALEDVQQRKFKLFCESFLSMLDKRGDATLVKPDEFNLLRFLKADQFNIDAATSRLLNTLIWRRDNNVDRFIDGPPTCFTLFQKLRIRKFHGFDNEGRPLLWERLGEFLGSSRSFGMLTCEEWIDCHTFEFMHLTHLFREASIKNGKPIMEHCYLGDLSSIKLWPFLKSVPEMTQMAKGVEPHFPEIAGPLYMFNAPVYAARLFSVAKRILDARVVEKLKVRKGLPSKELAQNFPPEYVLSEYGGKCQLEMEHVLPEYR